MDKTIGKTTITGLLVDDLQSPHDIGPKLGFSWRMKSARQGAAQKAFRIRVRTPHGETLWDSGEAQGRDSVDIPYSGQALSPARRYVWNVCVRDERGEWAESADAEFSTGFFAAGDWRGSEWIGAADDEDASEKTVCFAREFQSADDIDEAWLCATALGAFRVFANGAEVAADAFLKPGFTSSSKTKHSFCREITGMLNRAAGGRNAIVAEVSSGWWRDEIMGDKAGLRAGFRAVILLRHADGSVESIGTDARWRAAAGAGRVTRGAIFSGEDYDARRPEAAEAAAGFAAAVPNGEFTGAILPMQGPTACLREDLALPPAAAYVWKGVTGNDADNYGTVVKLREWRGGDMPLGKGETLVVDFGQNCAAVPEFEFSASRGTTLSAHPAEMLNDGNGAKSRNCDGPEGSTYTSNYRIARATARYTFAGDAIERYRPSFSFFGGRYLAICADGDVTMKSVRWIPVCSIPAYAETARFNTSDATLNRLAENILWGQRSNYLSVPTDCPQRDERCGWTADTLVFTKAACYNADVRGFLRKWLGDMRDAQRADGAFPGAAPLASHGQAYHQLGWGDAGVLVPWTLWRHFGDLRAVEENWDAMVRFTALVDGMKYGSPEAVGHQWADWLSFEKLETKSGRAYVTGKNNTPPVKPDALKLWRYLGCCYWLMDARAMADMAEATGRAAEAASYREMAGRARDFLRASFTAPEDGMLLPVFRDMQTPALFALRLGILDPEPARATRDALLASIRDAGECIRTGFLGTWILLDTLCDEAGAPETAYSLLLQHGYPSWLYSVDQGATTIWERWNSYTKAGGLGDVIMNSFNHYAYGAVFGWMMGRIAGIREDPAAPGFRHFVLSPLADRRLGAASASYRSPYGEIKSEWRFGDDGWTWRFTIPANSSATVALPGEKPFEAEAGTHEIRRQAPSQRKRG